MTEKPEKLAGLAGLEPTTHCLEGSCSVQMSYRPVRKRGTLYHILAVCACTLALSLKGDTPRNVILFIGDGMSVSQRMVAEEFARKAGHGSLAMNSLPYQATTRTCSVSSLVTDSAAAATAIACGVKTVNGAVGVDEKGARVESCAEAAHHAGRRVGIVTSVTINHATPAGFYAHRKSRAMLYEIGLDLVRSGFDLFLGGGLAGANDKPERAEDAGDLYAYAASNGWHVCEGRAGLEAAPRDKPLWWRSGEQALPYAIDSRGDGTPRLPELTRFALDRLGDNFFLMVEGGRIDWAGHANDAATNLRDLLELDDAVKVALDFCSSHPDTLVVVTGDHETGGMSLGFAGTGYAFYMERLAHQTCSAEAFRGRLAALQAKSFDEVKPLLTEAFGFKFDGDGTGDAMALSESEIESLKRHFEKGDLDDRARRLMSEKAGVGWTSGSHTGLPALTTSTGPGAEKFTGLLDNTDISRLIKAFYAP